MHSQTTLLFHTLLLLIGIVTTPSSTWQLEIHNQIGFMAERLINPQTQAMIDDILYEPEWNHSIGRAGAWADTVRRVGHPYSYTWHFISARDDPPRSCGLYYHRDCQSDGCVVQQIANQTGILEGCLALRHDGVSLWGNQLEDCSNALKWVVHFIGDVAQPLHASDRVIGGNGVPVVFGGKQTNLHQVWDHDILYTLTPIPFSTPSGVPSQLTIEPYFLTLLDRIYHDAFRSPVSTWAPQPQCSDFDARRGTFCPELWAKDSNAIVCDYVYGRLPASVGGNGSNASEDLLSGPEKYAEGAFGIVEEQIAKAAWRLSRWLDELVSRVERGEGRLTVVAGAAEDKKTMPVNQRLKVQPEL